MNSHREKQKCYELKKLINQKYLCVKVKNENSIYYQILYSKLKKIDELNEKEADMKSKYEKMINNMKESHKILLFTSIVIKI